MEKPLENIDADGELLTQYKAIEEEEEPPKYFVDTTWFNLLIGFFVCLTTLIIGLDVDYAPKTTKLSEKMMWFIIDLIFTIIFILEMAAKQYFYKWEYFKSHSNKFDFFLVLLSILDTVMSLAEVGSGLGKIRMLRMMRLIRLVRLVRLVRMFKELWLVVSGLIQSARTILWVSVLLLVLVYVTAIVTTLSIGRNPIYDHYYKISGGWDHRKYFGTLPRSMLTMFQIVTLENWCDPIVRHVLSNQPAMAVFFVVFIFLTSFGLLNLVVGIIVENTLSAARNNTKKMKKKEEYEKFRILDSLRDIFERADVDASGTMEAEEFQEILQERRVIEKLRVIGIPVEEANELFSILDVDGSGILSVEEFIGGCLKLKGIAKSTDLLAVQSAMVSLSKRMQTLQNSLRKEELLVEKLDVLTAQMTRNYSAMLQEHAGGPGRPQLRKQVPGTFLPVFPPFL